MAVVLRLRRLDFEAMVQHSLEDAPVEACGVIARREGTSVGTFRARNTEQSPFRFSIDPRDYLRIERALDAEGSEVAGFYHSHTGTPAIPSPTDIRAMMGAGFVPPFIHFVVGVADRDHPEVRAWHIENGDRVEQEYEIVE